MILSTFKICHHECCVQLIHLIYNEKSFGLQYSVVTTERTYHCKDLQEAKEQYLREIERLSEYID